MFHAIEKFRRPAQVLLGLIAVSFVGFGLVGFQLSNNKDYIVRVGNQVITRQDVDRAMDNMQQAGGTPSRETVFQTLLDQAYLMEGAQRLGIVVSDTQIKQSIVDNPIFHDASGKFDSALFQSIIQRTYGNEEFFMREERQRLTVLSLLNTLGHGATSDAQALQVINAQLAPRYARSVPIVADAFASKVAVNDAALQKYYDEHKKEYVLPEAVKFEYVLFSPEDLIAKQTVSDEEIQQAFAQSKNAMGKRRVAHILFEATDDASRAKAKEEAEKVAAELKNNPEKFAQLAKQYSKDSGSKDKGGDLGEFSKDGELAALISETLESTAFALASGQVSGVVESEFGFHILRVSDVSGNDLASQKEKLLAQIKEKKANTAYNKLRDDFADASFNQAEALKPSADKFGLTVQNSNDWVTRKSNDVPAAVLEVLFSEDMKTKKHNSDAIVVQGKTWFVRVLEARAEANQAFDAVKDKVKTDFVASESQRLAKAEAEKMLADLRAGKKVELAWSPVQAVVPQQIQAAMPADAYAQFMAAVPKNGQPAFTLLNMQPALQLVEVQKIEAFGSDNPLLPQAKKFALQNNSNNLIEAFIDGMRGQIKTKQGLQTLNHEE